MAAQNSFEGDLRCAGSAQSYGIDDSHLNVALKAQHPPERELKSLPVEDGETALGYLQAFAGAQSRPFCDGAFYETGSSEESLGAERLPARSRSAPLRLQPALTMRGGARSWRERMVDVEVDRHGGHVTSRRSG